MVLGPYEKGIELGPVCKITSTTRLFVLQNASFLLELIAMLAGKYLTNCKGVFIIMTIDW